MLMSNCSNRKRVILNTKADNKSFGLSRGFQGVKVFDDGQLGFSDSALSLSMP